MRADNERRVPVPAQRIFAASWLRLDAHTLAGALVKANQGAVLQLCINNVRIFRVYLTAKAIAAVRHEPVAIGDAGDISCARRTSKTEVVLSAAVDVVKRRGVISGDVV